MKNTKNSKALFLSISLIALIQFSAADAKTYVYHQPDGLTMITNSLKDKLGKPSVESKTLEQKNSTQTEKTTSIERSEPSRTQINQKQITYRGNNINSIYSSGILSRRQATIKTIAPQLNINNTIQDSVDDNKSISAPVLGKTLKIRTCDYDAGAICSLRWGNKEFIDDYDHGRQLQSASSFDGLGEDFNPTEAGGSINHYGKNPSDGKSILLERRAKGRILQTYSQMAFWNPVNGVKTSNHTLNKQVAIGYDGLDNVIEYLTQFNIPADENHFYGVFEAVTAYLPTAFSTFWVYDNKSKRVNPLSPSSYEDISEQNLPVIAATADQRYALGLYSPDSPQRRYEDYGYGGFLLDGTPKLNNVFRISNPKGSIHFRSYVIIGTLEDVRRSMEALHKKF